MRLLIIGLGSIGARHLSNLKRLAPDSEIAVLHHGGQSSSSPADERGRPYRALFDIDAALSFKPQALLVTGPASEHVHAALPFARAGAHLFIEKPLAASLDGVDELLEVARENRLALMTAYNFRFCEPLRALRRRLAEGAIGRVVGMQAETGQYLPDWRPEKDYRTTVSAQRRLGGGAMLELSHELDIARWLLGEVRAVSARASQLGDLEIDVEDSAEVVLKFDRAVAGIHLDMIRRAPRRRCSIFGTEGQIEWDGLSNEVRLFSASTKAWTTVVEANTWDRNTMYLEELKHFLDCVRTGATPFVDGVEGRRTLEVVLAAKKSSEERREISL